MHLFITTLSISESRFINEKFSFISISPICFGLTFAVFFIKLTNVLGVIPSRLPTEAKTLVSSIEGDSISLFS